MRQAVRRWKQLDALQRRMLIRVTLRALAYRAALLVTPWRVLARRDRAVIGAPQPRAIELAQWAVEVAKSRVPFLTCLALSFAARDVLAQCGVAAAIDIGVIRDADGVRFHAVARAGESTIGQAEGMTLLTSLPAIADKG